MILRRGSNGQEVSDLQKLLNNLGWALAIDGDFGSKTENAVKEFQSQKSLMIDGVVGAKTLSALGVVQTPTQNTNPKINPLVIDIYRGENVHSFQDAYKWGIRGVIHKATEGTGYKDATYAGRKNAARTAGLLWGAYHFFRPGNVSAQVDWFIKSAGVDDNMLLALDHEDGRCSSDMAKDFLSQLEAKTGIKPVLYSGNTIKEQLGNRVDPVLGRYRLWLAQYSTKWATQRTWNQPWLWQFTGDGLGQKPHEVDGITHQGGKGIDINHFFGDEAKLRAEWVNGPIA